MIVCKLNSHFKNGRDVTDMILSVFGMGVGEIILDDVQCIME